MNALYPLKFKPQFKDKIWGGRKIKEVLGFEYGNIPNCGEAWMLSGVQNNISVVSNGFLEGNNLQELIEVYMDDLVGEKSYYRFKTQFPILVKLLDASDWLSIQVHPNDELAQKRNVGLGKTEMWYILEADQGSRLISGFSRDVNPQAYLEHLKNKGLQDILNYVEVEKNDVFYTPAGRVHALGPGILLAEIQQSSDTTYRIYDWDRIDASGISRELHTELALDAIDFSVPGNCKTEYRTSDNQTGKLVKSPYFTTNLVVCNQPLRKNYEELDSFVVLMAVEGHAVIKYDNHIVPLERGEVSLIPASLEEIEIHPVGEARILEIYN